MKLIHCADLHLDSKMNTNLDKEHAKERKTEILHTFERMVLYAAKNGIEAILIARDMFDTKSISAVVRNYAVIHDRICRFLKGYRFPLSNELKRQLNSIRDGIDDYQNASQLWEEASSELKIFERENDMAALSEEVEGKELPSLEELNSRIMEITEKIEETHNAIASCNRTLEDLQERYNDWEETKSRLEEQTEIQEQEKAKHDYVFKAWQYLSQAKQNMTERYADSILKGFRRYYEMITGTSAEVFHIDADTSVTVGKEGKRREIKALSSGYRDLVGICLRVALAEAMYQDEVPFLVMDDPFMNLDDRKVGMSRGFGEGISGRYQVVYFTCSNFRV